LLSQLVSLRGERIGFASVDFEEEVYESGDVTGLDRSYNMLNLI
jgi:ubiquinone/menaquinone biosynthesis C-methylase UbiE